jgi:4-amino-4-deoxy-L-arabinose transferase-like glycosyltransferase
VFCVVALPWYVLCQLRNPDFLRIFIFQHNFERYLTPMFQHRQPFWYFLPILLLGLLPWTAGLWPALAEGLRLWREKSWSKSPGFFVACWAVFPFLFFSFSQSKLPGYVLPAIPPLALLAAVGLQRQVLAEQSSTSLGSSERCVLIAIGVTWIVMALSAVYWTNRLTPGVRDFAGKMLFQLSIIVAVGGIVVAVLGFLRKRGALLLSFLLVALSVELAGARVLPALDPSISARPHADYFSNERYADRIFTYHIARSWQYGFNFYFGHQIQEWNPQDPAAALVLTTPDGCDDIRKRGRVHGVLDEYWLGVFWCPVSPAR